MTTLPLLRRSAPPSATRARRRRAELGATARTTFRALGARNYRLYVAGHVVSVTGTWMQTIALTWLVLRLQGGGLALGLTAALQYLPLLLLGPLVGVVVDRVDKRRLLLLTQSTAAVIAVALAALTLTGAVHLGMVLAIALALGLVNAFDVPTRQTFAYEMVGPDLLPNAITLNSIMMNVGRIVGPALAGLVIAVAGLGVCFALNAASYATLLGALLLMRTRDLHPSPAVPRARGQLRAGLRYVARSPEVRAPLVVMALIGTFTYEFQVMLPVLARTTFGGDAADFSLLMAAMGVGSVLGGVAVAARLQPSARRLGRAGLVLGVLVLAASAMPSLVATAVVLVAVGAASISFLTLANSTLQLHSAPEMRGRVIALYAVAFLGSIPVGGPIMGALAETLGARTALAVGGTLAVAAVGASWRALAVADERAPVPVRPNAPAGGARRSMVPAAPPPADPFDVLDPEPEPEPETTLGRAA